VSEEPEQSFVMCNRAAYFLGVPQAWLKREAEAGRLPCLKIGKSLRFNLDAVRNALNDRAAREIIDPQHQQEKGE
jgi:hypothetical protein